MSNTTINGEIDCLDPGGFGSVTITQSITIDCTGTLGSILASGVAAVIINIPAGNSNDPLRTVRLRGISLNGTGTSGTVGTRTGTRGVSILSAAAVFLEDMVISDFAQQGVADLRTAPGRLFIRNSVVRNNGAVGVVVAATGGTNVASIENVHSINNAYGLAIGSGNQIKVTRSVFSGNTTAGVEADPGAQLGVDSCTINYNGAGVTGGGSIRISNTDISYNTTGISTSTTSFGNNRIYDNGSPGIAPSITGQQ